ncbi:uncharacterized protein DUF992 [Breoghania corrubedonensis]|uniref:Uncharacterized protein DUF992 n=1 Tax=Breoghania corrubedonensis TaxID=665038 RepID=A0A2T5V5T8_9HYPH|nr:DUF992 domain-containing protein [Breoghania corrubedonensis]PTW59122.1 uncharacterized protein DUF992 [Breoghania corrubedonensis]
MTRYITTLFATAAVAGTLAAMPAMAADDPGIKVGVLNCTVAGGSGFIFGSSKEMTCVYNPVKGTKETYVGRITKYGIDVGETGVSKIAWGVLAPSADMKSGALEGDYVGLSAEATVGGGVGANALVGGLDKSITLNPVSVQVQNGLNVAAGIAQLKLTATN